MFGVVGWESSTSKKAAPVTAPLFLVFIANTTHTNYTRSCRVNVFQPSANSHELADDCLESNNHPRWGRFSLTILFSAPFVRNPDAGEGTFKFGGEVFVVHNFFVFG